MKREVIDRDYISVVKENENMYYEDYLKAIEKSKTSTAIYKGEPVPFLYMPKLYTGEDFSHFQSIMSTMMGIIKKVIDQYKTNADFRKKFPFSKELEELILVDHSYSTYVPMGRFDIFYHDKNNFKFCELNADGSSAMNEDRELGNILSETLAFNEMKEKYNMEPCELFDTWIDECIKIYSEFGGVKENPNVVIVDFIDKGTTNEFKVFKERFERRGYNTVIADPRDLKYVDGKLYKDDFEIDIVYRRLVTRDMMEKISLIPDFVQACREGKVCIIGPIKSQIIHNKIFFKVLHDEDTLELLSDDEKQFVKNHIPYTEVFEGNKDFTDFINNKDSYILKPCDYYASKGVYAGRDFTEEQWKEKLDECFGKDYLIQEYYCPPKTELVHFVDGNLEINEFNNITGIYLYNEKVRGVYTRVGRDAIISGLHEYYTLPTFIVR